MSRLWGLDQTRKNSDRIAADPTIPSRAAADARVPAHSSDGHPAHQSSFNEIDPNVGVDAPDGHIERDRESRLTKRSRRDSRERPAMNYAGGGVDGDTQLGMAAGANTLQVR